MRAKLTGIIFQMQISKRIFLNAQFFYNRKAEADIMCSVDNIAFFPSKT